MVALLPVCPRTASSQTVAGTLHLRLDDRPVPDVRLRLMSAEGDLIDSTRTDAAGRFALSMVTVVGDPLPLPARSQLGLPYPNPFNPSVRLPYVLSSLSVMQMTIYNALGQPVRQLSSGLHAGGAGQVEWDGRDDAGRGLAAGTYLVQMTTASGRQQRKVTRVDGARSGTSSSPVSAAADRTGAATTLSPGTTLVADGGAITTWRLTLETAGDQGVHYVDPGHLNDPLPPGGANVYELVGVPGGPFLMGSDDFEDESPPRQVTLSPFYLGRREVTVANYATCVEAGTCAEPATGESCNDLQAADRGSHPVNCITWYDAATFCAWAGLQLPTEAQWEKAARGSVGRVYPWGDEPPGGAGNCDRAVMMRAGLGLGCGHDGTGPVGERPAGRSVYGIDDLVGNVWEWTQDIYDPQAYGQLPNVDPVGDHTSLPRTSLKARRAVRGNSWYYVDPDPDTRAANRFAFAPLRWLPYVGVRCAANLDETGNLRANQAVVEEMAGEPGEGWAADLDVTLAVALEHSNWLRRNQAVMVLAGDVQPSRAVPADDDMVQVEAGRFRMGSADGENDERPLRQVYIDAFRIDRYEVTVGQYRRCVEAGTCREPHHTASAYRLAFEDHYLNWDRPGREAHPVNGVSWYDADTYCRWAGKQLPTEAQWERAARGDDGRVYPWGDSEATCQRAIIDDGGDGCGHEMAWPVGSRPEGVSPYGVNDLAGNVWEWTADWYAHGFYGRGQDVNPLNDEVGQGLKVLRGGSMADQNPRVHRSTNRLGYPAGQRFDYTVGFRCAADGGNE